jgi:hypothetical protein
MSGYKAGYSETHSPMWEAGYADGQADVSRIAEGKDTMGMDPGKVGSAMYQRGYADGMGDG